MDTEAFKPDALIGKRLATYRLDSIVGKGGMGCVYYGRDLNLNREVAIKILHPGLAIDPEYEKRFVREARNMANINHRNIVQVYYAGRAGDILFMAMEFVKGVPLNTYITTKKPDVNECVNIITQVCSALKAAHAQGVVHRDIKPTNIMITSEGDVKVMDFGIAKSSFDRNQLTKTGEFWGTPEYASPEQCTTTKIDQRSDIYSLGVVFYEMLTGTVPHTAETPLALFRKIAEEQPANPTLLNPQVPKSVEAIVLRMMEKDLTKRYQNCDEILSDLEKVQRGEKVTYPTKRVAVAAKAIGYAAAIGVLVVLSFLAGWYLVTSRANDNRDSNENSPASNPKIVTTDFPIRHKKEIKTVISDFPSSNNKNDWLSAAIPDILGGVLEKLASSFRVVNRTDVLLALRKRVQGAAGVDDSKYREEILDVMKPDFYITGNIHRSEQAVRVRLYCYDGEAKKELFNFMEQCKNNEDDVFDMMDKISEEIVSRLKKYNSNLTASVAPSKLGISEEVAHNCIYGDAENDAEFDVMTAFVPAEQHHDKGGVQPPAGELTRRTEVDRAKAGKMRAGLAGGGRTVEELEKENRPAEEQENVPVPEASDKSLGKMADRTALEEKLLAKGPAPKNAPAEALKQSGEPAEKETELTLKEKEKKDDAEQKQAQQGFLWGARKAMAKTGKDAIQKDIRSKLRTLYTNSQKITQNLTDEKQIKLALSALNHFINKTDASDDDIAQICESVIIYYRDGIEFKLMCKGHPEAKPGKDLRCPECKNLCVPTKVEVVTGK